MADDAAARQAIGFIGGGNMARAIIAGLLGAGTEPSDIFVSEPSDAQRNALLRNFPGLHVTANNAEIATRAGCIVLAVKPQILARVCRELEATVQTSRPLVISIAAGVRSGDIDAWLGGGLSIVRVMPNQPALLRLGASGLYANPHCTSADRDRARDIAAAVGAVVVVPQESDIDIVTAVSGSGPAYFYLLIDMLIRSAEELGLDPISAASLAVETARGAAELAAHNGDSMESLIAAVRSPGGTTAAALDSLEHDKVRAIFLRAITAARDRAIELADKAHEEF
jgi:pyrroline-5-carboxylate reductase